MTTDLGPLIVTALPGIGIKRTREGVAPLAGATKILGVGQRHNSQASDYVVFARGCSRVKRADLPAFWMFLGCSVPGPGGSVVAPGCLG
jgi:hypothetical protein